ncbi:hypothetical protein AB0I28_05420 [Phytomonospora sp. NPDC050363]|uniref:hypothetical protein n=1 Tax=Phytomonospora sp. NPDC050363 TaxID=3155642 RepID=UPI003405C505
MSPSDRLTTIRRIAGFAAAGSVSLYLAVKLVWVASALIVGNTRLPGQSMGDWIALNVVTIAMAGVGVALGLALAMRWGARLPAAPVVFVAWVGAGLLVPMIPVMILRGLIGESGDATAAATTTTTTTTTTAATAPAWHDVLLVLGFGGMAAGLAVAVPIYVWQRWPRAFDAGPVGRRPWWVLAAAGGLAALWSYWAFGGEVGLRVSGTPVGDRLLLANSALWALVGAVSLVARGRVLTALGFAASGSLFGWGAWRLLATVAAPGGFAPPALTPVALVEYTLGVVVGVAMFATLLRRVRGSC